MLSRISRPMTPKADDACFHLLRRHILHRDDRAFCADDVLDLENQGAKKRTDELVFLADQQNTGSFSCF